MNLGRWGEKTAAKYLRKCGYSIIEHNFSCRLGELDLVARDQKTLVFIEVKTRRSFAYGLPCESITEDKKKHIKVAINYYLMINGGRLGEIDLRIDIIELLILKGSVYVRHTKNAF